MERAGQSITDEKWGRRGRDEEERTIKERTKVTEREKYRGRGGRDGEKDREAKRAKRGAQATVFHAHHPFYILISPLLRRLSEAEVFRLVFALPELGSIPLTL